MQVDTSLKDSFFESFQGLNLNLPPKESEKIDVNLQPAAGSDFLRPSGSSPLKEPVKPMPTELPGHDQELHFPINDSLLVGHSASAPTEPQGSSTVLYPTVNIFKPSLPSPKLSPVVNAPASSEGTSSNNDVEDTMLKELEAMGFKQVNLNKEVLRMNEYNMEQSVDDLCEVSDWDPILEELQEIVEASPAKRVLIDHHLNPAIEGVVTVSHPEASSTCELVFRVICQLGGFEHLNQKIAAPIYCGMMTDTGGFTYNSTRPEIYTIIGMLLTTGIDKDKIYRNVFNNYNQWAIRFRGYLMSECLTVADEYHAAYFTVSRHDMKRFHFVKGDLEGLVNEPLRIKGLKFSVSLREDDRHDNLVLVSLRSVDDFPCNEVAAEFFNGGGHLNASGGKLHCSLKEAEAVTQRAILKFSNRLKA